MICHRAAVRRILGLLCVLVMAGLAVWALQRFGFTLLGILFLALALGCVGAAACAWRAGERTLRDIERAKSQLLKTFIDKGERHEP